jgi:hypothetical protein
MTPGSRSVTILLILGAAGVMTTFVPEISAILTLMLLLVAGSAVAEFLQLRTVSIRVDRPDALAFSLGEVERYSMRISTSAAFPVELQVRQIWPGLVAQPSSQQIGICRPGEVVQFDFEVQAVERGVAELPPPSVRLTRWRLGERTTVAGDPAYMAVTTYFVGLGCLL